ncbi:36273_t:CDS:2, partial [Gigaspora margarita]
MSVPMEMFPKLKRTMSEKESSTSSVILPDLNIRLICPICKTPQPKIIEEYANGDLVCGECGLVLRAALETTISSKGKVLTKTHFKATVDKNTLTLKHALHEIEAMLCTLMDLSKEVIDTTKLLYKRTVEEKVIRGKNKI